MARTPMTPERFQARDVKRRLSKIEKDLVYRDAALSRLQAQIIRLERDLVDHLEGLDFDRARRVAEGH